ALKIKYTSNPYVFWLRVFFDGKHLLISFFIKLFLGENLPVILNASFRLSFYGACLCSNTSSISSKVISFVLSNTVKWYNKSAASFLNRSVLSSFASITNSTASSPTFWATLLMPFWYNLLV